MSTKYEIVLNAGETELSMVGFILAKGSTKPHLEALNWFAIMHQQATEDKAEGNPYLTVYKWVDDKDPIEFGDASWCDADFTDLPQYVQKQIAPLIEYDRSINQS